MLSKILKPCGSQAARLLAHRPPQKQTVRLMWGIPPSQYDIPMSDKLKIGYACRVYWELIPVFVTTGIALSFMFLAFVWGAKNKVDLVFTTHSRANISRTMDLRNPSVHKMIIINQRYEPWPEMQDVLDKMVAAEKRALVRMQSCSHP